MYIAMSCVWDTRCNLEDVYQNRIRISDCFEMYNQTHEVSAYVVNFEDDQGEPSGYVVVGVTSEYPEIIEFSDTGISPYEKEYMKMKNICDETIYLYFEGEIVPKCIDKDARAIIQKENGEIEKNNLKKKKIFFVKMFWIENRRQNMLKRFYFYQVKQKVHQEMEIFIFQILYNMKRVLLHCRNQQYHLFIKIML